MASGSNAARNIDISADSFELDGEKNEVKAIGKVEMRQGDIRIWADHARYNKSQKIFYLYNNIIVRRGKMKLTCKKIRAYEDDNRLEAVGDIRFFYKSIQGTAGKATYHVNPNEVILTENPKAWQSGNSITGNKIIVNLTQEKITTRGNSKLIFSPETEKGAQ